MAFDASFFGYPLIEAVPKKCESPSLGAVSGDTMRKETIVEDD